MHLTGNFIAFQSKWRQNNHRRGRERERENRIWTLNHSQSLSLRIGLEHQLFSVIREKRNGNLPDRSWWKCLPWRGRRWRRCASAALIRPSRRSGVSPSEFPVLIRHHPLLLRHHLLRRHHWQFRFRRFRSVTSADEGVARKQKKWRNSSLVCCFRLLLSIRHNHESESDFTGVGLIFHLYIYWNDDSSISSSFFYYWLSESNLIWFNSFSIFFSWYIQLLGLL